MKSQFYYLAALLKFMLLLVDFEANSGFVIVIMVFMSSGWET